MADQVWTNWEFWSALVAGIALVKSEFPPISNLFGRPRIEIEVFGKVGIFHHLGNPNVNIFLSLTNIGKRDVKINKIDVSLANENGDTLNLPAQAFFPDMTKNDKVIFSPFKLSSGSDWKYAVQCFNPFSREDDEESRRLSLAIKQNIQAKITARTTDEKKELVYADAECIQRLTEFCERHYKWRRGEYMLSLRVQTNRHDVSAVKKFRFTLYDSDILYLKNITDGYKCGAGIYYPNADIQTLWIPMTENSGAETTNE